MDVQILHINDDLNTSNSDMIAGFDFEHTLIKPLNSRKFSKDVGDWMWLRPNVPDVIQKYHADGYRVLVFTNQTEAWKLFMINTALTTLGIPITVMIGFGKNSVWKKPNKALFYHVIKTFDTDKSFYTGDAADATCWSDMDRQFANNIGIKFKNINEIFPFILVHPLATNIISYHKYEQEMIINVGYSACGKTTFTEVKFVTHGYVRINCDLLKTSAKILKECIKQLKAGKSIVVDSTASTVEKRAIYINLANTYGVPVRCFLFPMSIEIALEWNAKRFIETGEKIPKVVYYKYRKYYIEPTEAEGCGVVSL